MTNPRTETVTVTAEEIAAYQDMNARGEHYAAKEAEWEAAGRPLAPMNEDDDQ